MRIKKLKINGFGKLENKEIEFGSFINLVSGNNESGKSTVLKFIQTMFYGTSKNKNGKFISDYERYTPWKQSEFSGKIQYELDNGVSYEIFREFKKKNPKIYNEKLEDISGEFKIDKTNGNQFFLEQTNVDEELFLSTIVSEQGQVQLQEKEQTNLIQKLSNLVGTGEDTLSFQKIMNRLNKRQLEEIGTVRSQDRPINMVQKRLETLQQEKQELISYQLKQYQIEEMRKKKEQEIHKQQIQLEVLKKVKQVQEKEEIEQEKIKANTVIQTNYEEKIAQLKSKQTQIEQKEVTASTKNTKLLSIGIAVIMLVVSIVCCIVLSNKLIGASLAILTLVYLGYILMRYQKKKKQKQEQRSRKKLETTQINNELEVLENTINMQKQEIKELRNTAQIKKEIELEQLQTQYNLTKQEIIEYQQIKELASEIESLQQAIQEEKVELYQMEIEQKQMVEKLENLAQIEEEIEQLQQKYEELIFQSQCIELAKQEIQQAYLEMKQTVTPKFTTHLSEIIKEISDGAYQTVKFDEENGIIVEIENGDYISAKNLSMGTLDQLYLSLRLGVVEEMTKEKLPILLDEAFAYYDTERLTNVLKYLNQTYKDRQIIIFTCTNREKEILEQEKIPYQEIML